MRSVATPRHRAYVSPSAYDTKSLAVIHIQTLGSLSVRGDNGGPLAGAAAQPRRMAVLALLWPDADDERGSRTLAQALYALRRDLIAEDAIVGSKELRFDPAHVSSDVSEFASAVSRGDDARAAQVYAGPFLDGFHLSGAGAGSRALARVAGTPRARER